MHGEQRGAGQGFREGEMPSCYLAGSLPALPTLPPSPAHSPSLVGWGHWASEVRSLFEGQIINPTK